ncbi:phospholipid/cholesterol/gamma-HCH transport system substrate-binding protein [Amycolatopsis marina]|uniref:Phospholipid/cholesterol/gamma-HCH transport system substrate-binding protein n=1 Tax=Amycolatopsis marina TaxID=490629 RepID=A0A1I1BT43_9PSEU|nr:MULTISPECIES: MlaD family protein [Amycolatopsis]SFB53461.1 phospholipid/cholesterol/gamma-HCH transport system substrate-binding protein [Amycolatopsis marina]
MRRIPLLVLAVAAVAAAAVLVAPSDDEYPANVVLPSATGLIAGSKVLVNGFDAGSVDKVSIKDGRALVTMKLTKDFAPLHSGASASIVWKAVLGERQLDVRDGPKTNPVIPAGGTLDGKVSDPVEMDKVLDALDPDTRAHLSSLVRGLDRTVAGNEHDLQQTVRKAGPTLQALGEVLRAVGSDGPAIKELVERMNDMVTTLVNRDQQVRLIVSGLSNATGVVAQQRDQLRAALRKLPATLGTADQTLAAVPGTVDKVVPLLDDLRPATDRLPAVARNLRPVLADLRPTVAQLRPTLGSLGTLLQFTPGLLDSAHGALPGTDSAVASLTPALNFLRPYTPEVVGWLSNWGSSAANYDSNGHYMRVNIPAGMSSFVNNPGVMPPGMVSDPFPAPGAIAGQPWTDAFGSGVR